jgi:hypothetical protein
MITLKLLKNIPKKRIYVFCAGNEMEEYKKHNPELNIVNGGDRGTAYCNLKIEEYFSKGQYIVQMDDDIKSIKIAKSKKRYNFDNFPIEKVIDMGLEKMYENCSTIWGLYPISNPMFMFGKGVSTKLSFLVGYIFGFINTCDCRTIDNCRDDYERSILRYKRDGAVIRFNEIAADSVPFAGTGGFASVRTIELMNKSAEYMMNTYPEFVKEKHYKNRKWKEIKIK